MRLPALPLFQGLLDRGTGPGEDETRTVLRSCTLCEALCGLEIDVTGDAVTAIRGDDGDHLSKGYLCPKGTALADLTHDPDRLHLPQRRQPDGTFATIGWTEAFDLVGDHIRRIQAEHGRDAFGVYFGNPAAHSLSSLFLLPFLELLGTRNRYSATSTDQLPQSLVSYLLYGHFLLFPLPDLDRTDHLLILGANPVVSNGSLVTAPDWRRRLKDLRARGGRVVVVDPRRTETAKVAGEHVAIVPGTDVFLLGAMVNIILEEGLDRLGRVAGIVDGVEAVRAAVKPFTVELAVRRTGIDAATIETMARDFANAPSAVAYNRVGTCQTRTGTVTNWLVNCLNVLTGRLDTPGGAMFAQPAVDLHQLVALLVGRGSHDTHRSRVHDLPETNGEFPVATLADEILTPGDGQVRGMLVVAGNPVLSAPNGRKVDTALQSLDFFVSIDFYVNESNRHADVILPPTSHLEHDHYDVVFHALAVRNTAKHSAAVVEPRPGAKHEYEILLELASRLGRGPLLGPLLQPLALAARVVTPMQVVAAALQLGPHGVLRRGPKGLTLGKLKQAPHGVDLGPLESCLPQRLFTDDKRVDLAPAVLVDALAAVVQTELDGLAGPDGRGAGAVDPAHDLRLVGRRHLRSNNSWLHNSPRLVKGRDRCTVLVHPDDAAARGVVDGQTVVVASRIGEIRLPAEVSDEMAPGTVAIPHGWGHDRDGVGWQIAAANAGVSVNDLTDDRVLDAVTGNAAFNDVRVGLHAP